MNPSVQRLSILSILVVATVAMTVRAQGVPGTAVTPGRTGTVSGVPYNALTPGQRLRPTEFLRSPNGNYAVRFRMDGLLTVYQKGLTDPVWTSGVKNSSPNYFEVSLLGELLCHSNGSTTPYWRMFRNTRSALLAIQDDGNLVFYDGDSMQPRWDRLTPSITPQSGDFVAHWTGSVGGVAYNSIKCEDRPSIWPNQYLTSPNGRYKLLFKRDGELVLFDQNRPVGATGPPLWQTGRTAQAAHHVLWEAGTLTVHQGADGFSVFAKPIDLYYSAVQAGVNANFFSLAVQDDGNLVVYDAAMRPWWARH